MMNYSHFCHDCFYGTNPIPVQNGPEDSDLVCPHCGGSEIESGPEADLLIQQQEAWYESVRSKEQERADAIASDYSKNWNEVDSGPGYRTLQWRS